ncbi:hypothetical protein CSB69_0116 [Morganella morganii]|nr:hypothetical protein CSB69_0116 [Morganella morganii]
MSDGGKYRQIHRTEQTVNYNKSLKKNLQVDYGQTLSPP